VPDNGSTKFAYALGGVVIGGLLVLAYEALKPQDDDERPPIIVRNGSLKFLTDVGWKPDGGNWEPDQPRAKRVKEMIATIKNSDGSCGPLRGVQFTVTFEGEEFRIILGHGAPLVSPRSLLTRDGQFLTHGRDGSGSISKIKAVPSMQECTFSTRTDEISIDFSYE
jgi:hypothetical protein